MRSPNSLCPCIPPINFWMPEPIFINLGIYIMTPEPVQTAYFINPSHQCVCILLSLLGNASIKTLPLQRIRKQQSENCWTRHFLYGPCRITGNKVIGSCQNFLLAVPDLDQMLRVSRWLRSVRKRRHTQVHRFTFLCLSSMQRWPFLTCSVSIPINPKRQSWAWGV
jgi:hypothetical protein